MAKPQTRKEFLDALPAGQRAIATRLRTLVRKVAPEATETFHSGLVFAAPQGAPVRAVAAGQVRYAGWFRGYGQMVILDHGRGDLTVCAHLDELSVEKGEVVRSGQEIGTVGQTGSLSEPGLYFELRDDGKPVDPRPWLGL